MLFQTSFLLEIFHCLSNRIYFLGCAAILAAAQPLKIVFVVVVVLLLLLLLLFSQINFYNRSFGVET